jgi:hypothetical protein
MKQNLKFLYDISFLSYFQSSLRNVIVFLTLSMAFIRQAVVYKHKNKLYNLLYLFFSFVFISIALTLNWILLIDTKKYNKSKAKSVEVMYYYYILYIILLIISIFFFFNIYRLFIAVKR